MILIQQILLMPKMREITITTVQLYDILFFVVYYHASYCTVSVRNVYAVTSINDSLQKKHFFLLSQVATSIFFFLLSFSFQFSGKNVLDYEIQTFTSGFTIPLSSYLY